MELFKVIILFLGVGLVQGQGLFSNGLLRNNGMTGQGGILGPLLPGGGLLSGLPPGGGLLGGHPGQGLFGPGPIGQGLLIGALLGQGPLGPGSLGPGSLGQGVFGRGPLGQGLFGRGPLGQGLFGRGLLGQGPFGLGPRFGNGNIFVPTLPSGTFATCKTRVPDASKKGTVTLTANVQDPPAGPLGGVFGNLLGATGSPTLSLTVTGSEGVTTQNYEVILTDLGNGAAGCTAANIGRVLASTIRGRSTGFNRFPLIQPRTGDGDLGTVAVAKGTATETYTNLPIQDIDDLAGRSIALCLNVTPAPTTTPILPFLPTFDQGRPVCTDAEALACCTFGRSNTMIS